MGINYRRKSLRLKHYDYAQEGHYFITIVVQNREHLFGEIVEGEMVLNEAGRMIHTLWYEIPHDFENIKLHSFVIMPNHIHGIIEMSTVGVPLVGTQNMEDEKILNPVGVPFMGTQNKGQPQGIAPTVGNVVGHLNQKQPTHT